MDEETKKELEDIKAVLKDYQIRIFNLEKSVRPKSLKWSTDEDRYLAHLATGVSLTMDEVRQRSTKFLRVVQAHQTTHERTERAISMRLQKEYFGVK